MLEEYEFITVQGAGLIPHIQALGKLRIQVFYEFPYLYEGTIDYEEKYLARYAQNPDSFVFLVYFKSELVGATTAQGLNQEIAEIKQPFLDQELTVDDYFYFGESILLAEHRGKGIGLRFFDERETFALKNGYKNTCFCAVNREENHPLKPQNYVSNDAFWTKRGYLKQNDLLCHLDWLDRGESEPTMKKLTFWMKAWN